MKKFWKTALRLATLATVVPVSVTHDESTGKTTYQSLLASLEVGPNRDGITRNVGVNLGEGLLTGAVRQMVAAKKESVLYADQDLIPSPAPAAAAREAQVSAPDFTAPEAGEAPAPKPCHLPDLITDPRAFEHDPYDGI